MLFEDPVEERDLTEDSYNRELIARALTPTTSEYLATFDGKLKSNPHMNHIPNIDAISGALIIFSLTIFMLNSQCEESARYGINILQMGVIGITRDYFDSRYW